MQQSVLYANANIAMQASKFLLTRERIRAMVAATERAELLSVLAECGYNTDYATDDEIIDAEREKTLKTFASLSVDDNLTGCVKLTSGITESNVDDILKEIEPIVKKIKNKAIREYFLVLDEFYKNNHAGQKTVEAEDEYHQRLDKIAATDKDNIFATNMLFWWFMEKQKELIAVKTILMNKRFGFSASAIRENLRGLYERFK
jgi:hypothetical protein